MKGESKNYPFIPYSHQVYEEPKMLVRSNAYYQFMNERRSVRQFSSAKIDDEVIRNLIHTAGTAPSGANKQPWTFCVIKDQAIKKQIRIAAEEEERKNYEGRMPQDWLEDLAPLGTDMKKDFLETAPVLIVVFKRNYELIDGRKRNNYYVTESVGIACGYLLSAIHNAGLVALTHTPSPMNFLKRILNRPENETPFLLIPVGYPHPQTMVPAIKRKQLDEILINY